MVAVIVLGALVLAAASLAAATAVLSAANRELRASCARWEGAAAVLLHHPPQEAGEWEWREPFRGAGGADAAERSAASAPFGTETAWQDPWAPTGRT